MVVAAPALATVDMYRSTYGYLRTQTCVVPLYEVSSGYNVGLIQAKVNCRAALSKFLRQRFALVRVIRTA